MIIRLDEKVVRDPKTIREGITLEEVKKSRKGSKKSTCKPKTRHKLSK